MKLDRLTTTGKACAGCRAALCCASDFMITEEEIVRVRAALTSATRLMLAANLGERHSPGATDATCPFLDNTNNRCAIYEDRPGRRSCPRGGRAGLRVAARGAARGRLWSTAEPTSTRCATSGAAPR